jgi:hypothetical protein
LCNFFKADFMLHAIAQAWIAMQQCARIEAQGALAAQRACTCNSPQRREGFSRECVQKLLSVLSLVVLSGCACAFLRYNG